MPTNPFDIEVARLLPVSVILLQNVASSIFEEEDLFLADHESESAGPHSIERPMGNMETIVASVLHDYCLPFGGFFFLDNIG